MGKKNKRSQAKNGIPASLAKRYCPPIFLAVLVLFIFAFRAGEPRRNGFVPTASSSATSSVSTASAAPKFISTVTTTQFKGLKIGLTAKVLERMGKAGAVDMISLACNVADAVHGSPLATEAVLVMREEMGSDAIYRTDPMNIGAVTAQTPEGVTYVCYTKPIAVTKAVTVHEFSHLFLGNKNGVLPYLVRDGLAGLCELVAEGEHGSVARILKMNARKPNDLLDNRLNSPGIAHMGFEDDPLMAFQYEAMALALYELYEYRKPDHKKLLTYLFFRKESLSWREFLVWAKSTFPEWVKRHHVLQSPKPGLAAFTCKHVRLDADQRVLVVCYRDSAGIYAKRNVEVTSGNIIFSSEVNGIAMVSLDDPPFHLANRTSPLVVRTTDPPLEEVTVDYPTDLGK